MIVLAAIGKLLRDLLYGGRNEYLDLIRLLGGLGVIVFLVLTCIEFAHTLKFDKWSFAAAFVSILTGVAAAIWGRTRIDRIQREDAISFAPGEKREGE